MKIVRNYSEYLSNLQNGQTSVVFGGEASILKICLAEKDDLPNGLFYIWNVLNDSGICILSKVEYNGDTLRILEGYFMENALTKISKSVGINDLDAAFRWWNLCYYRDQEGKVIYDSYYENLYVTNGSEKKLSDLHNVLAEWIKESFSDVEGSVYVLGDLANCNPIIYQLQQRGLVVKTLLMDNSEGVSDDNERLLQLREQLANPYCDEDIVKVSFIVPDGIDNCQTECHRSYLITIPIDLISINDSAVGRFSYKDILPSEEFCCDYSCCCHNYSYVEIELFADLHGNTILKTTNSKAESKYTIINRFNYKNLKDNEQSN